MTRRELRLLFDYLPDGTFRARKATGSRTVGEIVRGSLHHGGYMVLKFNNRTVMFHRAVYVWHHGRIRLFIDHIDGDRTNNRIENLREVQRVENSWNSSMPVRNTTGVKGLYWCKRDKIWYGSVQANYVRRRVCSANRDVAVQKLEALRKEMHGRFAKS